MTEVLTTVDPELAEHVIDLLALSGVTAVDRPLSDGRVSVLVRSSDLERAQDTIALLLPELIEGRSSHGGRLSDRLVRSTDATPPEPGPGAVQPGDDLFEIHDPAAEDDYVPPEPPPLPTGDLATRLAWLGAAGGPMLLVVSVLLRLPSFVAVVGLVGFVVGFGALVARMPNRARQDDGWDDGAVL